MLFWYPGGLVEVEDRSRFVLLFFVRFPLVVDGLDMELVRAAVNELCKYSHLGIGGRDATCWRQ